MLTTQIQVLLYVGSTQVVSCSIFVPLPAIVVKSHQTLEAILPYLPLSLKASPESQESDPSSPSRPQSPALPPILDGSSSSLVLASSPTSTSSPSSPFPPSSHHSHRHNHRRNGNSHHHHSSRDSTNPSNSTSNSNSRVSSNRVSPDCSIPSTTCIKISLQPTPTFKFVKPRCPHTTHRNKNLQHYLQHHQLPLPPSTSEEDYSHSSHSHRSHRHSHHSHRSHRSHNHDHTDNDLDSHSHSHSRHRHHSTYSHSPNHPQHHHRHQPQQHQRSYSSMAAIEYPSTSQRSTLSSSSTVSVLFTFPFDYSSKPTPESVQVTGSFNSWDRTPMSKNQTASRFESIVEIDLTSQTEVKDEDNKVKILFKFVLDGQDWVTDPEQTLERDQQGNLNNVLYMDVPIVPGTAAASSFSSSTTATTTTTITPAVEQETEAQRLSRQKQEEEDADAVIRQLGGGMWGAPMFAVNDPVSLPEHFVESTSQEDNTDRKEKETEEEEQEVQEISVTASAPPSTETETKKETEEERTARSKEEEDDAIIRRYGGGMWGAPMFAVNDPVNLPEHFVEAPEATEAAVSPTPEVIEASTAPAAVSSPTPVVVPAVGEDEDEAIIRQLGGGMWGAPNFKVNDPVNLPEHFMEAAVETQTSSISSTKSHGKEKATESVTVAEKDAIAAPITNSSSTETFVEGQIVKDEFVTTVAGTLIETVVETTEDTVIEAPDGTILEETITTDVQESVQGVLQESVTETTEIIEEIDEPAPGTGGNSNDANVLVEEVSEVVMMEEEEIKIVQGEDGVSTTIVEDTFTFMDGPEVDSTSLHSITTSIKPVQEGESILVEQAPVVHLDSVEILSSAPGYAKPSVDLSADVVATTPSSNVPDRSRVNGDEHEGDGDYGVVVLQNEPLTSGSGRQSVAGDAKPSIDMSVSTAQTIVAPSSVSPSKSESGTKAGKTEKRKSGFWKKIKKVLS